MRRLTVTTAALLLMSACGGSSSPTSPTAATPAPTPATVTVSGHVTATNGGQALSGVSARLGTAAVTTDGAGAFVAQGLSPALSMQLVLTGSSIVPRTITVAATATRDVSISAIALSGAFDLTFYRQLVRNGFEGGNEPLRRWTRVPSVRVRTVDDAGRPVSAALIAMAVRIAATAVPAWTGFQPSAIEQGAEKRTGDGWLTIGWADHVDATRCGETFVGGDTVSLFYLNGNCSCGGPTSVKPQTVRHELGHAFGFWHTDNPADAMYGQSNAVCDAPPSARELAHAAIAYARPVGNVDPDTDPAGAVNLAPLRVR